MMRQVFVTWHTTKPLPDLAGSAADITEAQGEGYNSGATWPDDHSANAYEKISYPQWSSHFGQSLQPAVMVALMVATFCESR